MPSHLRQREPSYVPGASIQAGIRYDVLVYNPVEHDWIHIKTNTRLCPAIDLARKYVNFGHGPTAIFHEARVIQNLGTTKERIVRTIERRA